VKLALPERALKNRDVRGERPTLLHRKHHQAEPYRRAESEQGKRGTPDSLEHPVTEQAERDRASRQGLSVPKVHH
jgi:hypothetical protein